jgi:hypothetical protein
MAITLTAAAGACLSNAGSWCSKVKLPSGSGGISTTCDLHTMDYASVP